MSPQSPPSSRHETGQERIDRNLTDLLQELRVAFPGVQILFAFLLVVPFQQGWADVGAIEKRVYYAALLLTAVSSVCFIAPTARHRMRFREHDLRWVVDSSHRLMVAGLVSLGGAISAVVLLVTMVVFSDLFALVVFALLIAAIARLWFWAPLSRDRKRP